eukprot:TRINITY_DN36140_c0_g1_i1.p1 TRINITY_DN36140_c0_g1~~TRINITY_DN36140_c0_g1_i1.p1  ORF type:complete len:825 (+),score=349.54 TRINITY_DN36140_c0_g1_i1:89-2476(+)
MAAPDGDGLRLSAEVRQALAAVLPSTDPYDADVFDPVPELNARFPSVAALDGLFEFASHHEARLQREDRDLRRRVRQQSETERDAKRALEEAQGSIEQLFRKVQEIRSMSEASEAMVKDICTEISGLDNAKHNIERSAEALGCVLQLNKALQRLETVTSPQRDPDLEEAAEQLTVCTAVLDRLRSYDKVPRVAAFARELRILQGLAEKQAEAEFSGIDFTDPDCASPTLAAACRIADVIGDAARKRVLTAVIGAQMKGYDIDFPPHSDDARMERMERRFVWLRRRLKTYEDSLQGVLPTTWCVAAELSAQFCKRTKDDIEQQLTQLGQQGKGVNIEILVRVLQKTIDFERDLTARVHTLLPTEADYPRRHGKQQPIKLPVYNFAGSITDCFDPHMGAMVTLEHTQMTKMLSEISIVEEVPEDDGAMVEALPSAVDIFFYIKKSLKHCGSFCKGSVIVDIFRVWVGQLCEYARQLTAHIPSHSYPGDHRLMCVLVNTADFCQETAARLAEEVSAKVDVDLEEEGEKAPDEFRIVSSKTVTQLIVSINKDLTPALDEMVATEWARLDEVGDQSKYITDLCQTLHQRFRAIGPQLQPSMLRYVCDKFVVGFMPRYIACIYKLKRLGSTACQQLLLDLQVLKSMLQDLPNLGADDRFTPQELRGFHRAVQRDVGRGEGILKLLSMEAPPGDLKMLAEHYYQLARPRRAARGGEHPALIEDPSVTDFRKIIELKGVPERERKALEEYLRKISGFPQDSHADTLRAEIKSRDMPHVGKQLLRGRGDKLWDRLRTLKGGDKD